MLHLLAYLIQILEAQLKNGLFNCHKTGLRDLRQSKSQIKPFLNACLRQKALLPHLSFNGMQKLPIGEPAEMKIIDAYWEKRNLGVESVEFEIESSDGNEVIDDTLRNEKQYNVVKVPAGRAKAIYGLTEKGYIFIECAISLQYDLSNFSNTPLSEVQKRMMDSISFSAMSKSDLETLFSQIRSGLFETDRICIDPFFTKQQAAERYINWIEDSIAKDAIVNKLIYKNESIGFFVNREIRECVYYPFLSGMYQDHKRSGLGLSAIYMPLKNSKMSGGRSVSTVVSTNNVAVLKMHFLLGFFVRSVNYVFIKHKS
jgi:hypothetical protein